MSITVKVDGERRTFETLDALMAFIDAEALRKYPDRHAPNGEPLCNYRPLCRHADGPCPGDWSERRDRWQLEQERAAAAPERAEAAS